MQQTATAALDAACASLAGIQDVLTPDRFTPPPPTIGVPVAPTEAIHGSGGRAQNHMQWAVSYSVLLWRCVKDLGGKSAASQFGLIINLQDTVWVCTHAHSCTCYFMSCNATPAGSYLLPADIDQMQTKSGTYSFSE